MNEMTAQDHRDAAKACMKRREESWDRSDTDGFMSQWASQITANEHEANAEILEAGGISDFWGLYEGDRRVKAAMVQVYDKFKFSTVSKWVVDDSDPIAAKRKWIPTGRASRIHKGLGLRERKETAAARAGLRSDSGGNCWVSVYRTGDRNGQDATLMPEEPTDGV